MCASIDVVISLHAVSSMTIIVKQSEAVSPAMLSVSLLCSVSPETFFLPNSLLNVSKKNFLFVGTRTRHARPPMLRETKNKKRFPFVNTRRQSSSIAANTRRKKEKTVLRWDSNPRPRKTPFLGRSFVFDDSKSDKCQQLTPQVSSCR